MKEVPVGIIGGGLMGREIASAFARWCSLLDVPIQPKLVGVADINPAALEWFDRIPSVEVSTTDHRELLAYNPLEVVYVAVPHHLHEEIYLDVLEAGKDLLAEKPFGIDFAAAMTIAEKAEASGQFVRCSSEFPFFPGAQRVYDYVRAGGCGRILEAVSGFHHASDLDPSKPANWKRQSATCGAIGVLGDLGMHVCHIPLRLKWNVGHLTAQLLKGYAERPDRRGGTAKCDTWDNAFLHTWVAMDDQPDFPWRLEMKRMSPGSTNTWFIEVVGTEGGVRFSTSRPKTLESFSREEGQVWKRTELGFETPFQTVTGGIFEVGFPDVIQQMWASYLMEREGQLGDRFGCVTVDEAVMSHRIFAAALASQENLSVESV